MNKKDIWFYLFTIILFIAYMQIGGKGKEEPILEEEVEDVVTPSLLVTVTTYNPVEEQCDSTPLITADGSKIDTIQLKKRNINWIAISRDLLGEYSYGDTIYLEHDDSIKEYVIHDTMNKRFTNRVDILTHPDNNNGMWKNVKLYKKGTL